MIMMQYSNEEPQMIKEWWREEWAHWLGEMRGHGGPKWRHREQKRPEKERHNEEKDREGWEEEKQGKEIEKIRIKKDLLREIK